MWSLLGIIIGTCMTMASFVVEAVVPGIHNLIRGHKFWSRSTKTSKIKIERYTVIQPMLFLCWPEQAMKAACAFLLSWSSF